MKTVFALDALNDVVDGITVSPELIDGLYYVLHDDGRYFVYGNATLTYSDASTLKHIINFNFPFVDEYSVFLTLGPGLSAEQYNQGISIYFTDEFSSTVTMNARALNAFSPGETVNCDLMAIGQWKP